MQEEHKSLQFLKKHWSKLLLGFLGVASIAAWGERFLTSNHTRSTQDFLIAHQITERFERGEPLASESIEVTENILKRHPELHPKLDTVLAMTYLAQAKPEKGLPYAKAPLTHVELPAAYQSYAETSLLIAEKRYDEALTQAQALEADQGSTLQALNLLRIVSLERELGRTSDTWERLSAHPKFDAVAALFQEGQLSLTDWHTARLENK